MKKLVVLLKKDIKESLRNNNTILMCLLPIVMLFIFKFMFGHAEEMEGFREYFILTFVTSMMMSVIPVSLMPMMIAEEKEKNTLRTLMLSNVTAYEFLFSKVVVTLILMLFDGVLIYVLSGAALAGLPLYLLVVLIGSVALLLIGAVFGIISPNQMTSGVISSPLMIVLMLGPMLTQFDPGLQVITQFIPTAAINNMISECYWFIQSGIAIDWSAFLTNGAILVGWTVILALIFSVVFKRIKVDN